MRKKVLVTAILCCIVSMTFAQMTLKGKVVDENEKPVAGASVWIEYTTLGTSTDENGVFSLQRVPEGKHTLRASALDYNGDKIDVASFRGDILFVLKKSPLKLNEVVVTGTGTHNRLKNTSVAMDMITKKELENINVPTFDNAMMVISPSFVVEPGFGIENIFDFVDDKPFGANYATLSPGRVFSVSLSLKFSK